MSSDPINGFDLSGLKQRPLPQDLDAPCFYRGPVYDDILFASPICEHYRVAYFNKQTSIFYNFIEKGRRYDDPRMSRFACPAGVKTAAQTLGVGGFGRAAVGEAPIANFLQTYAVGEGTKIRASSSRSLTSQIGRPQEDWRLVLWLNRTLKTMDRGHDIWFLGLPGPDAGARQDGELGVR